MADTLENLLKNKETINQMNGNVNYFLKIISLSVPTNTCIMNSLWFPELLGDHIPEQFPRVAPVGGVL